MSNFRVGQKVVSIKPIDGCGFHFETGLIITVAKMGMGHTIYGVAYPAFLPVEIDLGGRSFDCRYFRPLVTRPTDISIFTRILDRANGRERVNQP